MVCALRSSDLVRQLFTATEAIRKRSATATILRKAFIIVQSGAFYSAAPGAFNEMGDGNPAGGARPLGSIHFEGDSTGEHTQSACADRRLLDRKGRAEGCAATFARWRESSFGRGGPPRPARRRRALPGRIYSCRKQGAQKTNEEKRLRSLLFRRFSSAFILSFIPVGGSPTGAGESPALPTKKADAWSAFGRTRGGIRESNQ